MAATSAQTVQLWFTMQKALRQPGSSAGGACSTLRGNDLTSTILRALSAHQHIGFRWQGSIIACLQAAWTLLVWECMCCLASQLASLC